MDIDFSTIKLFKTSNGEMVTYEKLLCDIYENSEESRETMKLLVDKMTGLIKSPTDAVVLMEHITSILDSRVKNDDLLVKVASILSRIIQRGMSNTESTSAWEITEFERLQLLTEAEIITGEMVKTVKSEDNSQ